MTPEERASQKDMTELTRRVNELHRPEDLIPLRAYIDVLILNVQERIAALEKVMEQRDKSIEEQLDRRFLTSKEDTALALDSLRQHLAVMNEFRSTIDDILTRVVMTDTCTLIHEKVDEAFANILDQLKTLQLNAATLAGKASVQDVQDAKDAATAATSKAEASEKAAREAHNEAVSARRIAWAGVAIAALTIAASIIIAFIQAAAH